MFVCGGGGVGSCYALKDYTTEEALLIASTKWFKSLPSTDQDCLSDSGPLWPSCFLFLFSPCNAKLLHTSNMEFIKWQKIHSVTFHIELSLKCLCVWGGVLYLALLNDN